MPVAPSGLSISSHLEWHLRKIYCVLTVRHYSYLSPQFVKYDDRNTNLFQVPVKLQNSYGSIGLAVVATSSGSQGHHSSKRSSI